MAVRPVDSLTMLPRLNEAGRIVQQQEQHPYAFQQVLGASMQEKAQRARMQVRQKEKADQPNIGQDQPGKKKERGAQGERRRPQSEPQGRPVATAGQSGRLDVKV